VSLGTLFVGRSYVPALEELIRARMTERGWSYSDVAARGALPRSTLHKLATSRITRAPSPATIEHLARGLELDVALVRAAVADSLGLTVYDESAADPDLTVLIASVEQLTIEERRHVSALIASLLEQREQRASPTESGM
jgi:transcriptional regulator with XRE-family HTH domain